MIALSSRPSAGVKGDQAQALLGPPERDLLDITDATHVVLVLGGARLERRPLLGLHRVVRGDEGHRGGCVAVEDLEVILGVSLVELLARRQSHPRMAREEDAGAGAVAAGLPGALARDHVAVAVELLGVLAEVPDVAVVILRVPVVGDLPRLAVSQHHVMDHGGPHAQDPLGPVHDAHPVGEPAVPVDAAIAPLAARNEREPRIVHLGDEVARLQRPGPPRSGAGPDRSRRLRRRRQGDEASAAEPDYGDRRGPGEGERGPGPDRRSVLPAHICLLRVGDFASRLGRADERPVNQESEVRRGYRTRPRESTLLTLARLRRNPGGARRGVSPGPGPSSPTPPSHRQPPAGSPPPEAMTPAYWLKLSVWFPDRASQLPPFAASWLMTATWTLQMLAAASTGMATATSLLFRTL